MKTSAKNIFVGDTLQKKLPRTTSGNFVTFFGESFYKINKFDALEPFFMSLVSSSDHWLFISSSGGLTAGRESAENAIFPYYTVDKITDNSENTGNKAIFLVTRSQRCSLWEPFSPRQQGSYSLERNLYKNVSSTALIFEEQNLDLGLIYRYAWRTSEEFGFIKTSWLVNTTEVPCHVEFLDGVQNILPAGITVATQNIFSSLLDAYKRSEVDPETGLAIFALNSTLTDLAEPSESLLATTVMPVGLDAAKVLLSSTQLDAFRNGDPVTSEEEVRGKRGAYFAQASLDLDPEKEIVWHLVMDGNQDQAAVIKKIHWLHGDRETLMQEIARDIASNQLNLWKVVARADGLQLSNNRIYSGHHFVNVMFNLMRGGIFADQYWIKKQDFFDFVSVRNPRALQTHPDFFNTLPAQIHVFDLQDRAETTGIVDLIRLSYSYLPLIFSRRHGDPSRPWNQFSIHIKNPDWSLKIDYEGNWRDIFQNWEALAYAYPEFVESMISTFLNATTADGYNPYRITHHGIDWEVPEPENPWANIGYWSDHQIIYLQKLMEISQKFHPGRLRAFLDRAVFSYANVPYRIKPYQELILDPYNTIDFDWELEQVVKTRQTERGADGKLVFDLQGQVFHGSLAEKLLLLLLAKLVNFVPEGGIWMNTQRPEWNDANNALVGKGVSVVTLFYLRRYVAFCQELFAGSHLSTVPIHKEVQQFLERIFGILRKFQSTLHGSFDDAQRRKMMDELGQSGSDYRWNYYEKGFSGEITPSQVSDIAAFLDLVQNFVEHSLRANQRNDHLFHSYNILSIDQHHASIGRLYIMLEGQVAALSSGLLTAEESLALLERLRSSGLYQAEQNSYLLYPDREVPGFLQKNCLTQEQVSGVGLLEALIAANDQSLITRDIHGGYHFNGKFRNYKDVSRALEVLKGDPRFTHQVDEDSQKISALFEETFHHDEFTGRSGTFFAYEGLGSVYWHMVGKLLLAVQETALRFRQEPAGRALLQKYVEIRQGLGFNKSPDRYGAFPMDPYSHTPKGQGAKQPGMTGLVKEEILARQAEVGVFVEDGRLSFDASLLDPHEFLDEPAQFPYLDTHGEEQKLDLAQGMLAFTCCQTPVILKGSKDAGILVHYEDGRHQYVPGQSLDETDSRHIFLRDGKIHHLLVSISGKDGLSSP